MAWQLGTYQATRASSGFDVFVERLDAKLDPLWSRNVTQDFIGSSRLPAIMTNGEDLFAQHLTPAGG